MAHGPLDPKMFDLGSARPEHIWLGHMPTYTDSTKKIIFSSNSKKSDHDPITFSKGDGDPDHQKSVNSENLPIPKHLFWIYLDL